MTPEAAVAAAVFAVDPPGIGGVLLRVEPGASPAGWLSLLQTLLPPGSPWLRVPPSVDDTALLGGLDLAPSLALGRPVVQPGLLARANGGVLLLPMAERARRLLAAHLAGVLDNRSVAVQRDGLSFMAPARLGVVALDESQGEEAVIPALAERLALHMTLACATRTDPLHAPALSDADAVRAARDLLPRVAMPPQVMSALCEACAVLGIASLRAPVLAVRVARIHAALAGRCEVQAEDAAFAARLVLAPRATRLPEASEVPDAPAQPHDESPAEPGSAAPPPQPDGQRPNPDGGPGSPARGAGDPEPSQSQSQSQPEETQPLPERVVAAARSALPPSLLAGLLAAQAGPRAAARAGRSGELQTGWQRGRPVGAARGMPRGGARLHLMQTLRAAAPWQRLRAHGTTDEAPRLRLQPEDFHVVRRAQHRTTVTIFAVDASGSSALHRLAEAKGAVELMLSDCYVRRDEVAVLAFRGTGVQVLLPPTRSLARAKRSLAGLPGGGGTPLAAGLEAAAGLAELARRRGATPIVVVLTDGKANIARDGSPGRERAGADALAAARMLAAAGHRALLLDTSPRPHPLARDLADAMHARYLPLPQADAQALSKAVLLAAA